MGISVVLLFKVRPDVVLANVDLGDHVTGHNRGQVAGVTTAFAPCYHGHGYHTASERAKANPKLYSPPSNRSRYYLTFKGAHSNIFGSSLVAMRYIQNRQAKKDEGVHFKRVVTSFQHLNVGRLRLMRAPAPYTASRFACLALELG